MRNVGHTSWSCLQREEDLPLPDYKSICLRMSVGMIGMPDSPTFAVYHLSLKMFV